jgi:hypothetical protein
MYVAYDDEVPPRRTHPWEKAVSNPDNRYWDLRANPEQIPFMLEDFRPWSHYPAITRFYDLLTWLNGPDSVFESNDCGLRPPRQDSEAPDFIRCFFDSDPIMFHARLTILFRELAWNTSRRTVDSVKAAIHDALRENVRNYPAVVQIGAWEHLFTSIGKEGHAITFRFWAWGDDEAMAMEVLRETFDHLHGWLRWASDGMKPQTARS